MPDPFGGELTDTSTPKIGSRHAAPGRRLQFAGELEQEFRAAHLIRTRARTRLFQALELLVSPALAYLYLHEAGSDRHPEVLVCLAIGMTISVVLLILALRRFDVHGYVRAAIWLIPLRSMAFATVIAHFVGYSGAGTAVLTASAFGHFFFAGLLFHQALPAALATLGAYFVALLWNDAPAGLVGYAIVAVLAVQTMATVVAYDLQRAERIAFIEHGAERSRAEHDGLTGLRNRRDFDERFDAYWQQAMREREPLTVMLIDVDHFKGYNDRYGHQAGDDVLRRVARAVRVAARTSDVVARYGGEEFVILAPGLDESSTAALGERIRATVEQLGIAHEGSGCARVVTVSIGAAHVQPQQRRSPAGALQLADENLYRSKREGRNRFVMRGADYESLSTGRFRHSS